MLYPIIESFRLGFFQSNGTMETFIGLRNYVRIFQDANFWKSVTNTLYLGFFKLLIIIPSGFVIAYLINNIKFGQNLFKVLFFIPYVTSIIAAAMLFSMVYHPTKGLLNGILTMLHLPTCVWLLKPTSARWATILLTVWHTLGFIIVICIANLQVIPKELYEAAEIDGAKESQHFRLITIPQMKKCFAFLFVMGWIDAFKIFAETNIFGGGQGSPARSLLSLVGYVYERGIGGGEYGYASAAAYVLFLFILLLTMVNLKISKLNK